MGGWAAGWECPPWLYQAAGHLTMNCRVMPMYCSPMQISDAIWLSMLMSAFAGFLAMSVVMGTFFFIRYQRLGLGQGGAGGPGGSTARPAPRTMSPEQIRALPVEVYGERPQQQGQGQGELQQGQAAAAGAGEPAAAAVAQGAGAYGFCSFGTAVRVHVGCGWRACEGTPSATFCWQTWCAWWEETGSSCLAGRLFVSCWDGLPAWHLPSFHDSRHALHLGTSWPSCVCFLRLPAGQLCL